MSVGFEVPASSLLLEAPKSVVATISCALDRGVLVPLVRGRWDDRKERCNRIHISHI
ncbi:MAG: hypothetical protein METHAR1v1_10003 [Methanothrix sp.]|nr:MAG: hypothetical protein METHAR1v1_10003 [Methanothrix sp.]